MPREKVKDIIGSPIVPYKEDIPYNKRGRQRKYKRYRTYENKDIASVSNKIGRPSNIFQRGLYSSHFSKVAYQLCRRYGCLDKDLAEVFCVQIDAIQVWKRKYPDFKEAIYKGKEEFDINNVERSLIDLAIGYQYETKEYNTIMKNGKSVEVLTKRTVKQALPNIVAIKFYLANRDPDKWKDKKEIDKFVKTLSLELKHEIQATEESTAEVIDILAECGAFKSSIKRIAEAKTE